MRAAVIEKLLRDARLETAAMTEHDPEKACPGLDPGWEPVFGKDLLQQ